MPSGIGLKGADMDSDFKKWMDAVGFNGKEVTKAGAAMGIGMTSARERYRSEKEPSLTERLAMAAIAAGLPPWSPETEAEIESCGKAVKLVREVISEHAPSLPKMTASGHRIPAE
jgi:hypothetical protein